MDFSGFGSLVPGAGANGGVLGMLQKMQIGGGQPGAAPAAPAVPSDGSMQPTIGPGAAPPPVAPQAPTKFGLPPGGLLGILQGKSPQGLMGLLQRGMQPGAAPMGGMPAAGMIPGMPGQPPATPPAPPVQLPTDINPMNQF